MEILAFASFAILVLAWIIAPNTEARVLATSVEVDRTAEPAAA